MNFPHSRFQKFAHVHKRMTNC